LREIWKVQIRCGIERLPNAERDLTWRVSGSAELKTDGQKTLDETQRRAESSEQRACGDNFGNDEALSSKPDIRCRAAGLTASTFP